MKNGIWLWGLSAEASGSHKALSLIHYLHVSEIMIYVADVCVWSPKYKELEAISLLEFTSNLSANRFSGNKS